MSEKIWETIYKIKFEKINLPKSIIIKGNELSKKAPFRGKILKYRYRNKKYNYFAKINEVNIGRLLNYQN